MTWNARFSSWANRQRKPMRLGLAFGVAIAAMAVFIVMAPIIGLILAADVALGKTSL